MANHKSSKKRIRQTVTKRAHNRLYHKTARNAVKALRNTSEKSAAEALLPKVTSLLVFVGIALRSRPARPADADDRRYLFAADE